MTETKKMNYIKSHIRARRFINRLNKQLKYHGFTSAQLKQERGKYWSRILSYFLEYPEYTYRDMWIFLSNVESYEDAVNNMKVIQQADTMGLDDYINFHTIAQLILKGKDVDLFLKLAIDFKNYKLEENGQGNFKKLRKYIRVREGDLQRIVDVMIFTKNAGYPLKQKQIMSFYNSSESAKDNLYKLKDAWIYAKEHKLNITIDDLIQAAKYERDPFKYVINYNRILQNDIPIPYERFKVLDVEQNKITQLIGLLIKAKYSNIYIDFEKIYEEIKLRNVWEIIDYLIKFQKAGFDFFEYETISNFHALGGDLPKLYAGFLYNKKFKIIDDFRKYFESVKEITLALSKQPDLNIKDEDGNVVNIQFDAVLLVKSIELGKKFNPPIDEDEIIGNYLGGIDVYNILNYINYARSHNIKVSYKSAKLIDKAYRTKGGFKEVIKTALNPILFEGNSVRVTTKDNIEIVANMAIEAVLQPDNFFKGSDEKILFQRANAIFIDEVQRKYNHDEIIVNIEKIAENILFRLNNESRDREYEYIPEQKMTKVSHSHHGHTEQPKEQEHIHSDEEHHNEGQKHLHETETHDKTPKFIAKNKHSLKFIDVSKYKPLKVLIPRIDFVQDTFKEFEKVKEEFEIHRQKAEAEIEKLHAEIKIKQAWAEKGDLKYLILKDDEQNNDTSHQHRK